MGTLGGRSLCEAAGAAGARAEQRLGYWWRLALEANRLRQLPGADAAMVEDLERAVRASSCDPERLGEIRLLAIAVRSAAGHERALDARLDRLGDVGPAECATVIAQP